RNQKLSFAPNWITRVVTPCTPPPMLPKVGERRLRSTVCGSGLKWLKRLKISVRNSNERDSPNLNRLLTEKSELITPGRRIAPVRGELPKRPNGACANAAVLNHRFHVRSPFGRFASCPATRSGREALPTPVVSTLLPIAAGNPLCTVVIVETCQPSRICRATPLVLRQNGT